MNVLRHRFTSPRSDGPDPNQIQPSNWNDGHLFTGGAAGDVLTRDPGDAAYGAIWTPGVPYVVSHTAGGIVFLPGGYRQYVVNVAIPGGGDLHAISLLSGVFLDGATVTLIQHGASPVTLVPMSSAVGSHRLVNVSTSPTGTRIAARHPSATSIGGSAIYTWQSGYWIMIAHEQGGSIPLNLTGSNFVSASLAGIYANDFYLRGTDVHLRIYPTLTTTTVPNLGIVGLPFTYRVNPPPPVILGTYLSSGWQTVVLSVAADRIDIYQMSTLAWPAITTSFGIDVIVPVE